MTARPGTPEGDELDMLSTLVQAYEAEHYSIDAPDPIAFAGGSPKCLIAGGP